MEIHPAFIAFASGNKEMISKQREAIADTLGASANEIYFTAGGSESDNWALKATAEAYAGERQSHYYNKDRASCDPSHLRSIWKNRGFEVTYVDVDENGKVKLDELKAAIRPDNHPDFCYVCK